MTKIVCLVLLLAVVICSVFGWSCNDLNFELSSLSDKIITISSYAEDVFVQLGNLVGDDFDKEDTILSHHECYQYYVNDTTDNAIAYHLYSVQIKVKGDYHNCYCLGVEIYSSDLFGGEMVYYIVISDLSPVNSIEGWVFAKAGFWIHELSGGFPYRSYKNLRTTNKTLADIDHECQIQNGGN